MISNFFRCKMRNIASSNLFTLSLSKSDIAPSATILYLRENTSNGIQCMRLEFLLHCGHFSILNYIITETTSYSNGNKSIPILKNTRTDSVHNVYRWNF